MRRNTRIMLGAGVLIGGSHAGVLIRKDIALPAVFCWDCHSAGVQACMVGNVRLWSDRINALVIACIMGSVNIENLISNNI